MIDHNDQVNAVSKILSETHQADVYVPNSQFPSATEVSPPKAKGQAKSRVRYFPKPMKVYSAIVIGTHALEL